MTPQPPDDSARAVAFSVLRAVSERNAYANLLLPRRLRKAGLSGRDAAFATELTYGTLRRSGTYDRIAAASIDRPWDGVDPPVRDLLRLGTHQLLGMQVPPHAAVATTVTLARRELGAGRAGFVNAVLRRIGSKDYDAWIDALLADDPHHDPLEALALRHAHPRWVVEAFDRALAARDGAGELEALLAADNRSPAVTLVARPGRCDVSELVSAGGEPGRWSPWAVVWPGGDPGQLPAVREHRAGVQDEGSQLVAAALLAAPVVAAGGSASPERWLDMCAGPGGKAALLAALGTESGATLDAWELQPHRARLVERAVAGYGSATVRVVDAADPVVGEQAAGRYDRVLLDAPCTGTGALRRRPEARWRRRAGDLPDLVTLQRRLLENALRLVRPGGVVGYITCSPLLEETVEVVGAVRQALPDAFEPLDARSCLPAELPFLGPGPDVQLWPHRHGTDAMYLALLRRRS